MAMMSRDMLVACAKRIGAGRTPAAAAHASQRQARAAAIQRAGEAGLNDDDQDAVAARVMLLWDDALTKREWLELVDVEITHVAQS